MKRRIVLSWTAFTLAILVTVGGVGAAASAQDRDDYGRRSYYADYDRESYRRVRQTAFDFGFQDGSSVAREDQWKRKPYNPNPRGRYRGRDDGYRREFGDKNYYRAEYSRGYSEGYERASRR